MTNKQIPKRNSADFSDLLEYDEFEAYDAFQMPQTTENVTVDNVPLSVELAQSIQSSSRNFTKSEVEHFVKAPELFLRIDGVVKSQPECLAETPIKDCVELQYENEFDDYDESDGIQYANPSTSFNTIENDNEQLLLEGMTVCFYHIITIYFL